MAKETDLLKDPVSVAQLRYREQISAFKAQYLPDPKKEVKDYADKYGYRLDALRGK